MCFHNFFSASSRLRMRIASKSISLFRRMLNIVAFVLFIFLFAPTVRITATGSGGNTSSVLGFRLMPLVAYQENGNEGLEVYLRKQGFKYGGRFVPEDLNPEVYYSKKFCKGCTVDKNGNPKNYNSGSVIVVKGSYGFGPCTTIIVFSREKCRKMIAVLKKNGFKGNVQNVDSCMLTRGKTTIDFISEKGKIFTAVVWRDG